MFNKSHAKSSDKVLAVLHDEAQSASRLVDLGKATSFKLENQERSTAEWHKAKRCTVAPTGPSQSCGNGQSDGLQKSSIKDAGRMPWHFGPTKDVISCEKPRGGAHIHRSADV